MTLYTGKKRFAKHMENHGNGGFEDISNKAKSKVWEHFLLNRLNSTVKCKHCSKTLRTLGGGTKCLHNHLKSKHSITVPKLAPINGPKIVKKVPKNEQSFVCDICGKTFKKNSSMRYHMRRHMEKSDQG